MKEVMFVLLLCGLAATALASEPMKITSPDIREGEYIPHKFTCQGINVSPHLEFINVPDKAKSLALLVHDPDAPAGDWVHWVVFNIPANKFEVDEAIAPGIEGKNDFGKIGWGGPCPPYGTHHYAFDAYALDVVLDLKKGVSRGDLEKAMQGHILDKAQMVALYEKL